MLGPIVALLLLTAPAGPVEQQNCWLLCPSTPTTSGPSIIDRALGQDPDSLRQRVETLERLQQQPRFDQTYNPPSTWTGGTGSRGSSVSNCFGAC